MLEGCRKKKEKKQAHPGHPEQDVNQIKDHVDKALARCDEKFRINGRIGAPQAFPKVLSRRC
jgi:hypothetical protein